MSGRASPRATTNDRTEACRHETRANGPGKTSKLLPED